MLAGTAGWRTPLYRMSASLAYGMGLSVVRRPAAGVRTVARAVVCGFFSQSPAVRVLAARRSLAFPAVFSPPEPQPSPSDRRTVVLFAGLFLLSSAGAGMGCRTQSVRLSGNEGEKRNFFLKGGREYGILSIFVFTYK